MFSIVVPLGGFPFFVHACAGNIARTCGRSGKDLDLVFLISETTPPEIDSALAEAAGTYPFRTIRVPIDLSRRTGSTKERINHLPLLDWCVHHADIHEWMLVQHCDFFWDPTRNGWCDYIDSVLQPHLVAAHIAEKRPHFLLDGSPIPTLHDFVGVFNRQKMRDRGERHEV